MQEDYYHSIGMPVRLTELSPKITEDDVEKFADLVSEHGNRVLDGPKPLDRDDILAIFKNAYK